MAKKKAPVAQKRPGGPTPAVASAVFFALALLSVFVLIASNWMPELHSVDLILRGLGGGMRVLLPALFAWLGVLFANAARGRRIALVGGSITIWELPG